MAGRGEHLRYGFLAAGAMALGASGAAGAGALIDSGDVQDGSLKTKDLSQPTVAKLSTSRSILVSHTVVFGGTQYVTPGSDDYYFDVDSVGMVPPPPGKTAARGLAVLATETKGPAGIEGVEVTLFKNGTATGLNCTTGASGKCKTTGNVKAPSGSKLALAAGAGKLDAEVTISLALENR